MDEISLKGRLRSDPHDGLAFRIPKNIVEIFGLKKHQAIEVKLKVVEGRA